MEWLTVTGVERQTGIPNRTIRRYIRRHGEFLQTKKQHKVKFLAEDSLPVLWKIRRHYAAGQTAAQVEASLSKEHSRTLTVKQEEPLAEAMGILQAMAEEQKRLAEQVECLREELAETRRLISGQLEVASRQARKQKQS